MASMRPYRPACTVSASREGMGRDCPWREMGGRVGQASPAGYETLDGDSRDARVEGERV
jgi:hypothetical protein